MGYTGHTWQVINTVIEFYKPKTMLELGAQNDYAQPNLPAPFTREILATQLDYTSIDLSAEDGALPLDLSLPQSLNKQFDLVADIGTGEHIGNNGKFDWGAYYNLWLNKHNHLKVRGIMVNENPKSENWPLHGFNYVTQEFYQELVKVAGYKIIDLHEFPAMGNVTDGWNVIAVLEKVSETFPSIKVFKTLPLKQS